eukprot:CAMPEP_0197047470 /NCGR_PEP_ID=MMETSP1384-20130603/22958_1 /TAXON_ID=29189 /ORGANISM="Ammonia sp." /LENGTH=443 /DNA_ID=CAMNT_0042479397 /DNA_START=99 /DNA_END=1430 /DNA_ORIENTATION=+
MDQQLIKQAKQIVLKHSIDRGLCGVAVSVYHKNTEVFNHAYGFRDINKFKEMKPSTIFRIASISKSMSSVLMMVILNSPQYNKDKALSPKSTIREVLKYTQSAEVLQEFELYPIFKDPKDGNKSYLDVITINLLCTHRAGLRHYARNHEYLHTIDEQDLSRWNELHDTKASIEDLKKHRLFFLSRFGHEKLKDEPGEAFTYSSYGYQILGILIEEITKKSFLEAINELLFKPCKMNQAAALYDQILNTSAEEKANDQFVIPEDKKQEITVQYIRTFETIGKGYKETTDFDLKRQDVSLDDLREKGAGGGLLASASDVSKFVNEVINGPNGVVDKKLREYILRLHTKSHHPGYYYGIGFFLNIDDTQCTPNEDCVVDDIYHSGGAIGGCAYTRAWISENYVVTVLVNVQTSLEPLVDIARQLKELFAGQRLKLRRQKSFYDAYT